MGNLVIRKQGKAAEEENGFKNRAASSRLESITLLLAHKSAASGGGHTLCGTHSSRPSPVCSSLLIMHELTAVHQAIHDQLGIDPTTSRTSRENSRVRSVCLQAVPAAVREVRRGQPRFPFRNRTEPPLWNGPTPQP